MAQANDLFPKVLEQLEKGAIVRSDAIRLQLDSVTTFCNFAESKMLLESADAARAVLAKIHAAMSRIARHLEEPGHVACIAVDELQHKFALAQARVRKIEAALSSR